MTCISKLEATLEVHILHMNSWYSEDLLLSLGEDSAPDTLKCLGFHSLKPCQDCLR